MVIYLQTIKTKIFKQTQTKKSTAMKMISIYLKNQMKVQALMFKSKLTAI